MEPEQNPEIQAILTDAQWAIVEEALESLARYEGIERKPEIDETLDAIKQQTM